MTNQAATAMPSAADLTTITKGQTVVQQAQKAARQRVEVDRAEAQIAYYLDAMHKAMREDAPAAAADQIGWVSVFSVRGDFSEPGSGDTVRGYRGEIAHPGLETAWARLKAELAPLGYRFARHADTISTGGYDNPFETHTSFIAEWAAPWVTKRQR